MRRAQREVETCSAQRQQNQCRERGSPPATGHAATDHLRIVALAEDAYAFAVTILKPGGAFVAKVFQGGSEGSLLAALKRDFAELRHAKPAASRAESAETYVVAKGFRGRA